MDKKVIKRDGRIVSFNKHKIINAIEKAMKSVNNVDKELANKIAWYIEQGIKDQIDIEDIQDLVEHNLMCSNRKDVAQAYIRYRNKRTEYRNQVNKLDKKINELVDMNENVINENANKNAEVFNTKRDLLAGIVAKDYAERYMIPKHIMSAHQNGLIHWHDMDYNPFFGMFNCMLINFKGMLANGFTIGNAEVESPKSIKTATALISQIVANVSSNMYGGTTANNIDLILEPYAKRSYNKYYNKHIARLWDCNVSNDIETLAEKYAREDTKKEIYDSMQSLEYELNTLYNSNGRPYSLAVVKPL